MGDASKLRPARIPTTASQPAPSKQSDPRVPSRPAPPSQSFSSIALGAVFVVVADGTAQATPPFALLSPSFRPPFALSPPPCPSPTSAHAIGAATLVLAPLACTVGTSDNRCSFFHVASRQPVLQRTLRG
ncbi:hypothetical protein EKO04_009838 [Ascochyta lentis]|uniref:Uncharacterized protein n=1 Tax=Ascochyta lentis TaxID=205686 RepID=A0A8H7IVN0_9PLEO|nr:hypothetical protein EKO04_009838 [Ascochyta lentis]